MLWLENIRYFKIRGILALDCIVDCGKFDTLFYDHSLSHSREPQMVSAAWHYMKGGEKSSNFKKNS